MNQQPPPPGMHAMRLVEKEVKCRCGGTKWVSEPLVVILFNALASSAAEGTKIIPVGSRFKCPALGCNCYATVSPKGEWQIVSTDDKTLPDREPEGEGGGNLILPG